jgi:hypothetical protein
VTGLRPGATVTELVPGNPVDLDVLVARCGMVAQGLGGAAARVRAIDSGEWVGPAGDAFRSVVDIEPGRYDDAAAAFSATAGAVRAYTAVLRDAQASARTAITLYEHAAAATSAWSQQVDGYDASVRDAQAAAHPDRVVAGLRRPPAYDPGADDRTRALALLTAAREQVLAAGSAAARTIAVAWERAPREPHWWEKAGHFVAEIGRGAWEATAGLVEFAWQVSTVRMLVDPAGWSRDMVALGEGLWYGVQHPVELGKAIVDWDTWQESPGRAIGHLLPDLLIALASGGAGAAVKGARAARGVESVGTTFRRLDRLGEGGERLSYLRRARNFLSGEGLPAPNAGRHTPAGLAAEFQTGPPYGGVDRWFNATLRSGDLVGAGSVAGRELPFSGFGVPPEVVDAVGGDARRLFEGVQVNPYRGSYRDQVTMFRANDDLPVAVSYAWHNPQFGEGGLRQVYVHEMQALIERGVLEMVEQRPLTNTTARLDPVGAAP